jgi:hypothetical protein
MDTGMPVNHHQGVRLRIRWMTLLPVLVLAACSQPAPADSVGSSSHFSTKPPPSPVVLDYIYRRALGATVPAPSGWSVSEYPGTSVTVMSPPGFIAHGPRFTIEKLTGMSPAAALQDRCTPEAPPAVVGPSVVAGHPDSYEYLCRPRTFVGSEWTVLLPGAGSSRWRLTFLGASGVDGGRDLLSRDFLAVLTSFGTAQM